MTSFSKLFNATIQNLTCQELYHPWTSSCHRAWLKIFLTITPQAIKLIAPFVLLPLLYNGRDNDYPIMKKSFDIFVKMLVHCFGTVMSAFYMMCLLNKILGKFYIATVIMLPVALVSPLSYTLPSSLRKKYSQAFFSFVLEAAIKNSTNPVIKMLSNSKMYATSLFMCISGMIMYYLKINKYPLCWFIQPTKNRLRDATNNNSANTNKRYVENPEFPGWGQIKLNEKFCCDHTDLCDKHVLNGLLTYGKFGLGVEVVKRIISSAGLIKSSPLNFLKNIVTNTNYKFVKFMVSYGVLYRTSNCYFNRKFGEETPTTSLLAGIVAGIAFSIAPNYYFFTYGFATLFQLVWHALGTGEPQSIPHFEKLYNLPWSVILFGVFGGLMAHIRLFKPELLPQFAVKINDMISNGHTKQIYERIQSLAVQA